jgi:hypothetical protein
MTEDTSKAKRVSKRYPYAHVAKCGTVDDFYEIHILNISTSGIQFACEKDVRSRDEIRIQWEDKDFGSFDLTFLIKRKIDADVKSEFPHHYGAQYYDLSNVMKEKLLALLRHCRARSKKELQQTVEKITPKYLFEVIEEGVPFLQGVLSGEKVSAYFDGLINELKDYEKEAFKQNNDVAICLQKIVTHLFNCNLLGMMMSYIAEKSELKSTFLYQVVVEMQRITEVDKLMDHTLAMVSAMETKQKEKSELYRKVNESSNRLFYSKQSLLQSIIQTFGHLNAESAEFEHTLGKINQELNRINELTNVSYKEEILPFKRRSKKPEEFSKFEAIVDIPAFAHKKRNYLLISNYAFIFCAVAFYGFQIVNNFFQTIAIARDIGIQIDVKQYYRRDNQMVLKFEAEDWNALPMDHKLATYDKVVKFLEKDKLSDICILYDRDGNVIKILYEGMNSRTGTPGR